MFVIKGCVFICKKFLEINNNDKYWLNVFCVLKFFAAFFSYSFWFKYFEILGGFLSSEKLRIKEIN